MMNSDKRGGGEELEGSRGRETLIRIYYVRKNLFPMKVGGSIRKSYAFLSQDLEHG